MRKLLNLHLKAITGGGGRESRNSRREIRQERRQAERREERIDSIISDEFTQHFDPVGFDELVRFGLELLKPLIRLL
jgi:hypothetical protein